MGRKCGVEECLSDSNRSEDVGVTFHKIPLHPDIRPKWMSLCRIPEDKQNLKVIYICSRHFLKADFCNFKGKKYMLKQGVLPSVFPWNRCKMERIHLKSKPEDDIKKKPNETQDLLKNDDTIDENKRTIIKLENIGSMSVKEEVLSPGQSTTIEQKTKTVDTATGQLIFAPNTRIEALDFNQTWSPAKIVEVDYEENEVLVHFEKYSNKYDEWISMNSNTLRALMTETKQNEPTFSIGERCMAIWSDNNKFPATIKKLIDTDTYEVQFDDGYLKVLNGNKLSKFQAKSQQAPLFDPITSSKQERRDRKRKINIAALFGKKSRGNQEEKNSSPDPGMLSPSEESDTPSTTTMWDNGKPIGKKAILETNDGPRKSILVTDAKIPPNWTKHLLQRISGASAGKWDSLFVSPDGRKFRTKGELKTYLEEHPELNLTESMFDFSLNRGARGKKKSQNTPSAEAEKPPIEQEIKEEGIESGISLKIPIVDDAYKCPIEGCGKNFRRENLAQMHVKHYHPKFTKFLDSTPNVADLAYARTVGESLDRSPGLDKPKPVVINKQIQKTSTPKASNSKLPQSPSLPSTPTEPEINEPSTKTKDSEIIKLLNSKPFDSIKKEDSSQTQAIPSGLPPNMYPDIKLKDLLMRSEGIPKKNDVNLKSNSRPTGGIKTLLPVIRPQEVKVEEEKPKQVKRKRELSETIEPKPPEADAATPSPTLQIKKEIKTEPAASDIIIEGGEVIKIVQMKREEIINCTCGITEEDGLMIQCELCLCWQHAYCNNIERENQVPEKYICYICQNPVRQRSSKKYFHDQDWLKNGILPSGSYHCKDEELFIKRFERLKKSHDLTGGLLELKEFLHTMRMKINIAEAKNHPKLYLWSKPWEKLPLPEKQEVKEENSSISEGKDTESSMLMTLLKTGKEEEKLKVEPSDFPKMDLNFIDNNLGMSAMPIIPQPEAAIDSADCKINLLEHISHCQTLIEQRLDDFASQIKLLDSNFADEKDDYPEIRQTTQMILRDLNTLKDFSVCSTI